jgi:hypothetical protein
MKKLQKPNAALVHRLLRHKKAVSTRAACFETFKMYVFLPPNTLMFQNIWMSRTLFSLRCIHGTCIADTRNPHVITTDILSHRGINSAINVTLKSVGETTVAVKIL